MPYDKYVTREEWYNAQKFQAETIKKMNSELQESKEQSVNTAATIIKNAAETAAMSLNIQYIQRDMAEMKQVQKDNALKLEQALRDINSKDNNFVSKEDFFFWRNVLITGILLTIFLGIIANFLKK